MKHESFSSGGLLEVCLSVQVHLIQQLVYMLICMCNVTKLWMYGCRVYLLLKAILLVVLPCTTVRSYIIVIVQMLMTVFWNLFLNSFTMALLLTLRLSKCTHTHSIYVCTSCAETHVM